ncbi:MAG TPA: EamA family transporter, partial [Chitinophagaceae bacterium]|nr:EamA family transporter [Chitinophagaceae bacterium]
ILSNPVANLLQKRLTLRGQAPVRVNALTYALLALCCIPFALDVPWRQLPSSFWIYSVLGGLTGSAGNALLVKALEKGALSVLGPINAYKSVVGLLGGLLLLGEVPGIGGVAGIALIILGSYFVLDTTEERFRWSLLRQPAIQFRIGALVLTAVEAVFVKKVIQASGSGTAFISWCVFGALFASVLALFSCSRTGAAEESGGPRWLLYAGLVACIGAMQLSTNLVFEQMPVGFALALFQLSSLVSVFLGYRFFREEDIQKKLVGALIMAGGSALIILT